MKIQFNTEGGFAGLTKHLETDLTHLPPKLKKTTRKLIDEKEKYENLPDYPLARDIRKYKIRIENGKDIHTFLFNDLNLPEELLEFIYYMKEHAQQ
jgi:hypothetical protein